METNFQMLRKLLKEYHPVERGWSTPKEVFLIAQTLHLQDMSVLELCNLRDFTVVFLSQIKGISISTEDFDRMSAITSVIDSQIYNLGGEV